MARYKRGYACRCTRCQARVTIRHHPDSYWGANARFGRCGCGAKLRVDKFRSSGREAARYNCACMGYPFLHRRGSTFCFHGGAGSAAGFGYPPDASFTEWNLAGRPATGYIVPSPPPDTPIEYDLTHLDEDCPL